jgi:hypothetical protein
MLVASYFTKKNFRPYIYIYFFSQMVDIYVLTHDWVMLDKFNESHVNTYVS